MLNKNLFAVCILAASAYLLWVVFGPNPEANSNASDDGAANHVPYAPADWAAHSPKRLNISLYTFRDDNRNGNHDVGDVPMAGIYVRLVGPNGKILRAQSNINGYANFIMALDDDEQPIFEAGNYRFSVEPPPGWNISSGNPEQDITFRAQPGSPTGLTAVTAPGWVGLMPELLVTARVRMEGGADIPADIQATLQGPLAAAFNPQVDTNGVFSQAVSPGSWNLELSSAARNWRVQRRFDVTDAPVELSEIEIGTAEFAPLPYIVRENFDWLQRSVIDKIPNGHLGLNWDYLLAVHNQEYKGPGYVNGLMSGHAVAYNSSGHPVTISAPEGEVFDFVGGYFSVAWPDAQGETLEVTAWRNGAVAGHQKTVLSYLGPVWLQADMRSIDKLTLTASHYWQFVADDLKFRLTARPLSQQD